MKDNPYFIGIDPSITNTGVVILSMDGKPASIFNSKYRQNKMPKKTPFYSVLRYREIVESIILYIHTEIKNNPCVVAYEDYSYESENLSFTMGEFNGILKMRLVEEFSGIICIPPRRVKKFATGRGGASKEAMQEKAATDGLKGICIPDKQWTTDICDAYFLAKIAWYIGAAENAVTFDKNNSLLRERLTIAKTVFGGLNGVEQQAICNNYTS